MVKVGFINRDQTEINRFEMKMMNFIRGCHKNPKMIRDKTTMTQREHIVSWNLKWLLSFRVALFLMFDPKVVSEAFSKVLIEIVVENDVENVRHHVQVFSKVDKIVAQFIVKASNYIIKF